MFYSGVSMFMSELEPLLSQLSKSAGATFTVHGALSSLLLYLCLFTTKSVKNIKKTKLAPARLHPSAFNTYSNSTVLQFTTIKAD